MIKSFVIKLLSYLNKKKLSKIAQIYSNTSIGYAAKISNRADKQSIIISDYSSFYGRIVNGPNGKVKIGRCSTIRFGTIIESACQIDIGNEVIISNNVIITDNDSHPTSVSARSDMSRSDHNGPLWHWEHARQAPVIIEDNVWIGRQVMIMKGVKIGKGSIIASGTVVTKNVPEFSLCFGNPCIIKPNKYNEEYDEKNS
ncbi:DapH/DapD/GlmU-related protein [Pseudoalteromonas sp. NZS71]|uniref:acyltransferase n=1 Tax=Pseudoalteromonas sp. NZS71 TaxID=2792052 RepID=UPI001E2F18D6|nr:acyltransferase [Pseudoalteromonas sp. NZS71]